MGTSMSTGPGLPDWAIWNALRMMSARSSTRFDREIMLGHRHGNPGDIHLLEAVPPQQLHRNIAGNGHHGDAVHIGGGDSGDQISCAGAGGGDHHPRLSGGTGIAVGGVGGSLLVSRKHVADPVTVFIQGVVKIFSTAPPGYPNTVSTLCSSKHSAMICAPVNSIVFTASLKYLHGFPAIILLSPLSEKQSPRSLSRL